MEWRNQGRSRQSAAEQKRAFSLHQPAIQLGAFVGCLHGRSLGSDRRLAGCRQAMRRIE